ncbi:cag pathogenicity island type IV secretion system translocation protein CagG [Helicobacter pylori]
MKTNFYKIKLLFAWCLIIGMFNAPLNADQNTDIKDISPEDMALNSVGLVSRDQLKIEIPKETLEQKVAILNDYNDKNVNIKFDDISLGNFQPNDNLGINAMWGIQNLLMSQMMSNYGPNNSFMYGYAPTYSDSSFLPPILGY